MSYLRLLQVSVVVNIILAAFLVFVIRKHPPTPAQTIVEVTDKNQKVLEDLQKQVRELNEERAKAAADYESRIQKAAEDYASEIARINGSKSSTAASILKTHDNDIPGLTEDFNKTMGLKP